MAAPVDHGDEPVAREKAPEAVPALQSAPSSH
jgi:hypothetical protein